MLSQVMVDHVRAEVICHLGAPCAKLDGVHARLTILIQKLGRRKITTGLNEYGMPRHFRVLRAEYAHYGRCTATIAWAYEAALPMMASNITPTN